ncbi:Muskelin [Nymphon striatum]|nr:Muskelin [Nymphon striatum]
MRRGPIPAAGFTQRATIDPDLNEVHVLSGLSKEKDQREDNIKNSFWVYDISSSKWLVFALYKGSSVKISYPNECYCYIIFRSCIYKNDNTDLQYWSKINTTAPCPRFAHQLVYDHIRKVHYLFGGNPGKSAMPKMRLDDFWSLHLHRPSSDHVLRKCKLMIRQHRFEEMVSVERNQYNALMYLQSDIHALVDHNDEEEEKHFQLLASKLFKEKEQDDNTLNLQSSDINETHKKRSTLFNSLSTFFPEDMVQPKSHLADLIVL